MFILSWNYVIFDLDHGHDLEKSTCKVFEALINVKYMVSKAQTRSGK